MMADSILQTTVFTILTMAEAVLAISISILNEKVVSEISTRVSETLNIDSILKTAAEEIRNSLDLPGVSVRLLSNTVVNSHANQNGQKKNKLE